MKNGRMAIRIGMVAIGGSVLFTPLAQAFTIPDDIPFYQLEELVKELKNTCVWIKQLNTPDGKPYGSGFLVSTPKATYVVTCDHCVVGDVVVVSINVQGGKREGVKARVVKRDPQLDIAVLGFVEETKKKSSSIAYGLSRFDSTDSPRTGLKDGLGVMILGFPLNIGATVSGQGSLIPVTRIGIVAYRNPQEQTFLIDGFASHGNSGSPVISAKNGNLLGMVTEMRQDYTEAQDEKGIQIATVPYNSGLAQALTAKVIADMIKQADKAIK